METGSTAYQDRRPIRVRTRNLLIVRWRVALPDDPAFSRQFVDAVLERDHLGRSIPYATAKQIETEMRHRALLKPLRRFGDPIARSRSLRTVHGWGGATAMIATSWWMYRWSALLTDPGIAMAVSVVYVLMLYTLFRRVHNVESAWIFGAWLFIFCIGVCCVLAYRSTPPIVSSKEAGHWLRTEVPPHASRATVLAFIERHKNEKQRVSFYTEGMHHGGIDVRYLDQGWLSYCPPDVTVSFEFGAANRLSSVEVWEDQTCS